MKMPMIYFVRSFQSIECPLGENLMRVLQVNHIPVASSCRGEAVCGKCKVQVVDGLKNLSPPEEDELHIADREGFNAQPNIRLSCQVKVYGDILIDAPYW